MARRRIACDQARCVRYRSVPGTASRRGVACDTARRGEWASRAVSPLAGHGVGDGRRVPYRLSPDRVRYGPSLTPVSSHPGPPRRPHVSAMVTVRRATRPSSAMPRPNSACNRRRHRRCTNVYSFVWPWHFSMAPSAARLRRVVGPPSGIKAHAGQKFRSPFLCVFLLNLHFRTRYGTLSSGISDR